MSGGTFDYIQHKLGDVAHDIRTSVLDSERPENITDVLDLLNEAEWEVMRAAEIIERVDYYLAGDDSAESFRWRWRESVRVPWSEVNGAGSPAAHGNPPPTVTITVPMPDAEGILMDVLLASKLKAAVFEFDQQHLRRQSLKGEHNYKDADQALERTRSALFDTLESYGVLMYVMED